MAQRHAEALFDHRLALCIALLGTACTSPNDDETSGASQRLRERDEHDGCGGSFDVAAPQPTWARWRPELSAPLYVDTTTVTG